MRFIRRLPILLLITLLLAACEDDGDERPTSTPNLDRAAIAQTAFANPTDTPRPRASATPLPDVETELARTTSQMENAILQGDLEKYMQNVWQADPLFLTEHRRWAEKWAENPPLSFDITLSSISAESDTEAIARMTIGWRNSGEAATNDFGSGGSTITARFYRESAESEEWFFAGEAWQTVGLHRSGSDWAAIEAGEASSDPEKIHLYYLPDYGPITGTRKAADVLIQQLPGVYTIVARELQIEPETPLHIKIYDYPDALRSMVDITYLRTITSWNLPGETIRLSQDPVTELPPDESSMARLMTYAIYYQLAEDTAGNYPWWVLEGTAQLVVAKNFMTLPQRNNFISAAAGIAAATLDNEGTSVAEDIPQLQDWQLLEARTTVPILQESTASFQAGTFLLFIDDVYGQAQRVAWVNSMASEKTLAEACEDILGKSFEELQTEWLAWLAERA
jgi:hypothetical protein